MKAYKGECRMNVVFVKHKSTNKPYLFSVPDGVTLAKGTPVICDTCRGESRGTCMTPSADVSERSVRFFGPVYGAKFPLKSVTAEVRKVEQIVKFPIDKKANDEELNTSFLCVKDLPGFFTRGRIYNSCHGFIKSDDKSANFGKYTDYENFKSKAHFLSQRIFPLHRRHAKKDDYVYETDPLETICGRIHKVVNAYSDGPILYNGSDGNYCFLPSFEYFVIDGYHGEYES